MCCGRSCRWAARACRLPMRWRCGCAWRACTASRTSSTTQRRPTRRRASSPPRRALNDIGIMLLMVVDSVGAERALSEVIRRGATQDNVNNALIELMHCASFCRDRVGFARWRERCEKRAADMPPNIRADYYLKQGIGQARFGQFNKAEALMEKALEVER